MILKIETRILGVTALFCNAPVLAVIAAASVIIHTKRTI
jgi:hypothetical protein